MRAGSGIEWKVKQASEWLVAAALLLMILPVLLLIAAAIRMDSAGPALFVQDRLCRGGRVFRMYKFRTLRWDPQGRPLLNADGSTRVDRDDARLTRLGRILRRGWDELPQLLNVLKGEMALIGPRPDEPFHGAFYTPEERAKLDVLPGITGLPQAYGRGDIAWKERIGLDLDYIRNRSAWLDLKIAARTAGLLAGAKGAALALRRKAQVQ